MSSYYNSSSINNSSGNNSFDIDHLLISDNRTISENTLTENDITNIIDSKIDEFKNYNVKQLSWKILDSYFSEKNRLVEHHINSYNHLIDTRIPKLFKNQKIRIKYNYNESTNKNIWIE